MLPARSEGGELDPPPNEFPFAYFLKICQLDSQPVKIFPRNVRFSYQERRCVRAGSSGVR